MEALGIDIKLIIAQIFNFLVLLFLLRKFLYKPLLKYLDERKKKIDDSLVNAEKIKTELVKIEEEKAKVLHSASEEAKKLINEERKVAETEKDKIIEEARKQAAAEVEKGAVLAKQEMEKAKEELKREAVSLAAAMTKKIVSGLSDEEKHKLIESSL